MVTRWPALSAFTALLEAHSHLQSRFTGQEALCHFTHGNAEALGSKCVQSSDPISCFRSVPAGVELERLWAPPWDPSECQLH